MPSTNGFTLAGKDCDIEIENAAGDVYGFHSMVPTIPEDRASQLTASTGESSPTYRSAEPFETLEYTDWSYGMGQVNGDRQGGGALGQGGNPAAYFYGDCFTLRIGKLLPGMARDMIYNTVAGQVTPVTDGSDPNAGDEWEVPRGVSTVAGPCHTYFTVSGTPTITKIRVLAFFPVQASIGSYIITAVINQTSNGNNIGVYQGSFSKFGANQYTGWKWVTLNKISGTGTFANGVNYTLITSNSGAAIGGYIQTDANYTDGFRAYFQLPTSGGANTYKYWSAPAVKFEQLNNAGTYINVAINNLAFFNTAVTNSGGTTPASSPERVFGFGFASSIVFNNLLYISYNDGGSNFGLFTMTPANAAANGTAANTTTTFALFSPTEHEGNILFVNRGRDTILKWPGTFTAGVPDATTQLTQSGVIGQKGVGINGLTIFQGSAYVLKPEGVYKITMDISDINTNKPPTVARVWTPPGGVQLTYTGTWFCEHQGKLYFNWKNLVVELSMQNDIPTVQYLNPNPPWYRQTYYSYVNGLTSDGQNLYASVNNYGISAYNSFGWHPITEFYEQVAVEGQASGLRWLPSPQGGPDYLFCGDGLTVLKIPMPNNFQPYTQQLFQNHLNKCGYWIGSEWTGSLAEAEKNLRSAILRAIPNGWNFKLAAVVWQDGQPDITFQGLLLQTWISGLSLDSWVASTVPLTFPATVAKTKIDATTGNPIANTLAPATWTSSDFNNQQFQSKKLAVGTLDTTTTPPRTENVTLPVKVAKTQFILYFWNPTAGQASTVGKEIPSVDSLAIKHLPKLKYVARYSVRLDLTKLARIGSKPKGVADVNDSTRWLRDQWVAGDPLYFRFYDMTGEIVEVEGIIQGNHADVFPLDKGQTKLFGNTANFAILSLTEEG